MKVQILSMHFQILRVIKSCVLIWVYFIGFTHLTSDLVQSTLSISLVCITMLCSTVFFFRVPAPSQAAVDTVVGVDPVNDCTDDSFCMRVIGHRGAPLDAPENSLLAFQMCSEKGCNGVEFDVLLTADNVPIIFHDDTLERLTGSPANIRQMTWRDLSNIDISIKHPLKEKFQNTRIATLDTTVQQCLNNRQKMFIDIKEKDIKIVNVIMDLYEKYPDLVNHAVCSSFFPHIIYLIRRKNPKIVCSLAWRPYMFAYDSFSATAGRGQPRYQNIFKHNVAKLFDVVYTWSLPRLVYYMTGLSIVLLEKNAICGKVINGWRQKGVRVIAWTVNHPVEKQYFSRILKIAYMTDTLIGGNPAHSNNNARSSS